MAGPGVSRWGVWEEEGGVGKGLTVFPLPSLITTRD